MPFRQKLEVSYRAVANFFRRRSIARVTRAVPRTLGFIRSVRKTGEVAPSLQAPKLTVRLAAGVAIDEAIMAVTLGPGSFPSEEDAARVGEELSAARRLYEARGWLADPRAYHIQPPVLTNRDLVASTGWARGLSFEHLSWESEYRPHAGEPGADRWEAFRANGRAAADVVRHPTGDRPWLVCVHGYTMGYPSMGFQGLQSRRLHHELGLNLALPVLPLHGRRKPARLSGDGFLSFDMMNSIFGLAQAVWDIRRLITWIRQQGATSIGLYGVSLGGYTVALVAGIEAGLELVISGIPVTDIPTLLTGHSPWATRVLAAEHGMVANDLDNAHRVVSPLAMDPMIRQDRRFIFAGYGDRVSDPEQAHRLYEHWEKPAICWYSGGHLGYLWSPEVATFLGDALSVSGFKAIEQRPAFEAPGASSGNLEDRRSA